MSAGRHFAQGPGAESGEPRNLRVVIAAKIA
jgi:hypothetical protein